MTKRLMLLRHAKSSWTDPGLDDRERPLNARGISAAKAIGIYLRKEKLEPELVICSPAKRTRETWRLVSEQLKSAPKLIVEEALYDFGNGGRLIDCVRASATSEASILLVGHNPSMEKLALRLANGNDALRRQIEQKYPTGALAVFEAPDGEWRDLDQKSTVLVGFTRPKDLTPKHAAAD
jgi:phosphohistidine phosphatase